MTTPGLDPGYIRALLDEDPELAFLTFLGQRGLPMGQQRFLQGRFGDVQNQFRQQQGQQLAGGQLPTGSFFYDFLPNFGLDQYRYGFSPQARGMGQAQFNPRAQFLYPRR